MATRRWAAPLVVAVAVAGLAAGVWANYRALFPAADLYRVTGVFEGRAGDTLILVRHESIPGIMGEMTSMALAAPSKEFLDRADLRPGDRVRLTVRQQSEPPLLVEIRKIE